MFKPNCSLGLMGSIVSDRLELTAMSPEFMTAVLEGRGSETGLGIPDGWPDPHDAGFLRLRLRQLGEQPELEEWFAYAVVDPGTRELVGHAGFHGPPGINALKAADAVEVGYAIFEPYRRRGYATEVVRALIRWANETHGIVRFVASVSPENEPSLRLVRRLGFAEVGRHWDDEDGEELEFELRLSEPA
jgi:RimJ/RimL family protein N-acetyltransferase